MLYKRSKRLVCFKKKERTFFLGYMKIKDFCRHYKNVTFECALNIQKYSGGGNIP